MSGNKSPLSIVNAQFGGKDKLVDKLAGLVERGEEEADALKKRLKAASNAKLLKLLKAAEAVKANYGSKDKLAANVAELLGRAKDADYTKKLGAFSAARLIDMATSLSKRTAQAAAKAKAAPKAAAAKAKSAAGKVKATAAKAKSPAKSKKQ